MDHSVYSMMCLIYSKEVHNETKMTVLMVKYFTYLKHTALDRLPSSLERISCFVQRLERLFLINVTFVTFYVSVQLAALII